MLFQYINVILYKVEKSRKCATPRNGRKMDIENYRHELKFLCAERDLFLAENRIRHICRLDASVGNAGTYHIKSLYFDDYEDRCYYETQAGVDNRKKYRIRIYNNNTDLIKLECKYSHHNRKGKDACQITVEQCQHLMRGEAVRHIDEDQELLRRFLAERSIKLLAPKVIVEYIRAPYVYQAGNVRITFDRFIRSSSDILRFMEKELTYRCILPQDVNILEVKYDEVLPTAILELLADGQQLSKTSFSKYALCREYSVR